jgi:hypothetical protein
MERLFKENWDDTRHITYFRSLEGRMLERLAHFIVVNLESRPFPRTDRPPLEFQRVPPLFLETIRQSAVDPSSGRLTPGYYVAGTIEATVDAVAVVDCEDENGVLYQQVICYKVTVGATHTIKPGGIEKVHQAFIKMEKLAGCNGPGRPKIPRCKWFFVWVTLEGNAETFDSEPDLSGLSGWKSDNIDYSVLGIKIAPDCDLFLLCQWLISDWNMFIFF